MNGPQVWWVLAGVGFLLSSVGGLGRELLDGFAGRPFEAYCRLKRNRERFGAVLDHQDAAIRGSDYLRMIGTVVFLISGTTAIVMRDGGPIPARLATWAACAIGLMLSLIHISEPTRPPVASRMPSSA